MTAEFIYGLIPGVGWGVIGTLLVLARARRNEPAPPPPVHLGFPFEPYGHMRIGDEVAEITHLALERGGVRMGAVFAAPTRTVAPIEIFDQDDQPVCISTKLMEIGEDPTREIDGVNYFIGLETLATPDGPVQARRPQS